MKRNRFTAQATTQEPFDPASPIDQTCEAERRAAGEFLVRRLKRAQQRRQGDPASIMIGGAVALAGLWRALTIPDGADEDEARERFEAVMQGAWLQAMGIIPDGGESSVH